jgi:hypothetical protein
LPRKKRLDKDAEQVAIYLTPTEQLIMDVIGARRKKREESRTSPSEIVVDGLWKILVENEGITKEKIQELVAVANSAEKQTPDNLKAFPPPKT